jgi:hypothetical protein
MGRRVVVAWAILLNASARPRSRAVALGVVAATALAAASPAPADDHTHLKGRGAGVATPATVACPAGSTPLSLTGMGRASHLGQVHVGEHRVLQLHDLGHRRRALHVDGRER